MSEEIRSKAFNAVVNGDPDAAAQSARAWIDAGLPPLELINGALTPAIQHVGKLWEEGDYFLPELVSGAEAMKAAMHIIEPLLALSRSAASQKGAVIIGTITGDIHDIGKSLVAVMLRANGFEVTDLGADVPIERFYDAAKQKNANLVCISALLTTTMVGIKDVLHMFEEQGIRSQCKFLVGGAPITRDWALQIGADGYAANAVDAVREADRILRTLRD